MTVPEAEARIMAPAWSAEGHLQVPSRRPPAVSLWGEVPFITFYQGPDPIGEGPTLVPSAPQKALPPKPSPGGWDSNLGGEHEQCWSAGGLGAPPVQTIAPSCLLCVVLLHFNSTHSLTL